MGWGETIRRSANTSNRARRSADKAEMVGLCIRSVARTENELTKPGVADPASPDGAVGRATVR